MGDLDDRFESLRNALSRGVRGDGFDELAHRRLSRLVRRSGLVLGSSAAAIAIVAWTALSGSGPAQLHETPGTPMASSTPDPDASEKALLLELTRDLAGVVHAPLVPDDISFADPTHGAVIGSRCAGEKTSICVNAIETSSDGGRHWAAPIDFGPKYSTDPARINYGADPRVAATHVLMTDANTVWAYSPGLYVSRDGGRTFRQFKIKSAVTNLAPAGNTVWVAERRSASEAANGATISVTPADGNGELQPLPNQPPLGHNSISSLLRPGSSMAYILSAPDGAKTALFVSAGEGRVWARRTVPCTGDVGATLSADGPTSLWLVCTSEGTTASQPKQLFRSTDGGRTWVRRADPEASGFADDVVATSSTSAWRWGDRSFVYRTSDNGRTWQRAPQRIGGADVLWGFSALSATNAWTVSRDYASTTDDRFYVWRTTDGAHWAKAPLGS
jgi:hypothetical protein